MAAPLSHVAPVALFVSVGFSFLGFGLQSSVLGVRAVIEDFSVAVTGLLMSSYYVGFFVGALLTPRPLAGVGHVRVFAAFASVASSAILLHPLVLEPVAWAVMRLVTGFCYAGLYVVIESWLNEIAENSTRGRLLAVYGLVMQGTFAGGYLLLNLGDPGSFGLFTLTSILVSLSLVPIALSDECKVTLPVTRPVRLQRLYRLAPLGVVGCILLGAGHSTVYTMGSVYARQAGLTLPEISVFMAAFLVGAMLLQWPIGKFSDSVDRRQVIAATALAAAGLAVVGILVGQSALPEIALALVTMSLGGVSLPLYGLLVAHVNDYLDHAEVIAATARLMLLVGAGAVGGPALAGIVMAGIGPEGFYVVLCALHALIGILALLAIYRQPRSETEEPQPYRPLPAGGVGRPVDWYSPTKPSGR